MGKPIIALLLIVFLASPSLAKKKDGDNFKKVKYVKKEQKRNISIDKLNKTAFDREIDELIANTVGPAYRRATIYDIYPVELSKNQAKRMKHREQAELMDYYDYARTNLKDISHGVLPKVVKLNFDGDALWDYSILVNHIKSKENYLIVVNKKKILYGKKFEEDYLEPLNEGRFPTVIPIGHKRKTIHAPAMKMIAFDGDSHILFFDRENKNWNKVVLDY